jgi:hypothetical protein
MNTVIITIVAAVVGAGLALMAAMVVVGLVLLALDWAMGRLG